MKGRWPKDKIKLARIMWTSLQSTKTDMEKKVLIDWQTNHCTSNHVCFWFCQLQEHYHSLSLPVFVRLRCRFNLCRKRGQWTHISFSSNAKSWWRDNKEWSKLYWNILHLQVGPKKKETIKSGGLFDKITQTNNTMLGKLKNQKGMKI